FNTPEACGRSSPCASGVLFFCIAATLVGNVSMTQSPTPPERENRRGLFSGSVPMTLLRLGALALIDAFAIWLIANLFNDGFHPLAITLAIITLAINIIFLNERLYPFQWLSPGLALLVLMVVFPVLITIYYAF